MSAPPTTTFGLSTPVGPTTTIGIGEFAVSSVGRIVTHALGSCVAVVLFDPSSRVGGMIHCALPNAPPTSLDGKAGYYVDSGLPLLLAAFVRRGGEPRRSTIVLTGGASVLCCLDSFGVGPRNIAAVHALLQDRGLRPHAEDTGGTLSRTVDLDLTSGEVHAANPTAGKWALWPQRREGASGRREAA